MRTLTYAKGPSNSILFLCSLYSQARNYRVYHKIGILATRLTSVASAPTLLPTAPDVVCKKFVHISAREGQHVECGKRSTANTEANLGCLHSKFISLSRVTVSSSCCFMLALQTVSASRFMTSRAERVWDGITNGSLPSGSGLTKTGMRVM
jgi:hypothetical protein